jgi:hypothetical protein
LCLFCRGPIVHENDAIFRQPVSVHGFQKVQKKHRVRRASEPVAGIDGLLGVCPRIRVKTQNVVQAHD